MKNLLLFFVLLFSYASAQVFTKLAETNGEARNKTYDVIHYKIEIAFDEAKKMVIGKTTTTFVPYASGFSSVEFDAEDITVKNVTMGKKSLKCDSLAKSIKISLDRAYSYKERQ